MKATIEMNGYIITVNQSEDGTLSVQATKDDDVVEEFTINTEEDSQGQSQGQSEPDGDDDDDDDVMPFGGEEEDDLGDDDMDDDSDDMDDEAPVEQSDDSGEPKLESFSSFVRKRK